MKMPMRVFSVRLHDLTDFEHFYIKLSIRDISVRLQGLTSAEHYFEDAFTIFGRAFRILRAWNTNLKMSIRDIRMRLQDLTGLEH